MLLRGGVRVTPALSEGDAGGEGLPEHSRARCGRQAGRAVQGSLPLRAGKCDSELWELGLESSQGSMSGEAAEAAESVTPLCFGNGSSGDVGCSKEWYERYQEGGLKSSSKQREILEKSK